MRQIQSRPINVNHKGFIVRTPSQRGEDVWSEVLRMRGQKGVVMTPAKRDSRVQFIANRHNKRRA